ncbi:hypothetical protein J7T55_014077 [Diaporthe amygdali]|uniref:uncharacterized protein n=1 Tax=Phomopsis amygdali TaxID=1214568 RepID=UPI0022FF363A|nr:uncharacterized protein J7T55_014077 [Diaporthe amygdali]KAJ0109515.1 hypothetical protein J7T55_014077 [Diaporthe amygdali]
MLVSGGASKVLILAHAPNRCQKNWLNLVGREPDYRIWKTTWHTASSIAFVHYLFSSLVSGSTGNRARFQIFAAVAY